jgi:predicted ATPase with chaperone activity
MVIGMRSSNKEQRIVPRRITRVLPRVLEVMRQPLEDGRVTIARAAMTLTFPDRFMLTAAMNPCPYGYATDPQHICQCSAQQLQHYRGRVSGPLTLSTDDRSTARFRPAAISCASAKAIASACRAGSMTHASGVPAVCMNLVW